MTDVQDLLEALVKTVLAYCTNKQGKGLAEFKLTHEAQRILSKESKEAEQDLEKLIKQAGSRIEFMGATKELLLMLKNTLTSHNPDVLLTLKEPIVNFFLGILTLQKQAQSATLNLQLTPKTITHKCKGHMSKGYITDGFSEMGICVDIYLVKTTALSLIPKQATHNDIKESVGSFVDKILSASLNTMMVSTLQKKLAEQEQQIQTLNEKLSIESMTNRKLQFLLKTLNPKPPLPFWGHVGHSNSIFGFGITANYKTESLDDEPLSPGIEDISV